MRRRRQHPSGKPRELQIFAHQIFRKLLSIVTKATIGAESAFYVVIHHTKRLYYRGAGKLATMKPRANRRRSPNYQRKFGLHASHSAAAGSGALPPSDRQRALDPATRRHRITREAASQLLRYYKTSSSLRWTSWMKRVKGELGNMHTRASPSIFSPLKPQRTNTSPSWRADE